MKEWETVWERDCLSCGASNLTDEFLAEPYPLLYTCGDCGGDTFGEWRESDEPHPALWGTA